MTSDDRWDITDATNEAVDEVLSELVDDPSFVDRVLGFAEVANTENNVRQIKLALARIVSDFRESF